MQTIKKICLPEKVEPHQEELFKKLEPLNGVLFSRYYEHSGGLASVAIDAWKDQPSFYGDIPRSWVKNG